MALSLSKIQDDSMSSVITFLPKRHNTSFKGLKVKRITKTIIETVLNQ